MRKGFLVVRYINTKSLIHLLTGGMDNNTNDDNQKKAIEIRKAEIKLPGMHFLNNLT